MKTMKNTITTVIFMIISFIGFSQDLQISNGTTSFSIINNAVIVFNTGTSFQISNIISWNGGSTPTTPLGLGGVNIYGTMILSNNDTFPTVHVTLDSVYTCRIFSGSNQVFKFTVKITTITGITNHSSIKTEVKAYPNPATEMLDVSFITHNQKEKVEIFDIQGRLVMNDNEDREEGKNILKLDVMPLSNGIYFVRVGSETFKITKQ